MSYINRWIAAIAVVMSLFMGACATGPPRATLEQVRGTERQYSIPNFGTLKLTVPPSWQGEIKPEAPGSHLAFTVRYTGKAPEDFQVLISIYVEAATKAGVPDPETIRSLLTEASKSLRARAVEKDIAMLDLQCREGKGYYYSVTDATYKPGKPGDYQYMTQGMCPVGGRLLFFTVLTNSKDSDVVDRALHAAKTAERVASERPIAQIDSSERVVSERLIAQIDSSMWVKSLKVSPDNRRVAWGARIGNKWFVVVDGKEEKQYNAILTMGGGRIIFDSSDSLHYLALKGSKVYLVEERIK